MFNIVIVVIVVIVTMYSYSYCHCDTNSVMDTLYWSRKGTNSEAAIARVRLHQTAPVTTASGSTSALSPAPKSDPRAPQTQTADKAVVVTTDVRQETRGGGKGRARRKLDKAESRQKRSERCLGTRFPRPQASLLGTGSQGRLPESPMPRDPIAGVASLVGRGPGSHAVRLVRRGARAAQARQRRARETEKNKLKPAGSDQGTVVTATKREP